MTTQGNKSLLDACVWGLAAEKLRIDGFDVEYVGEWDSDPGDNEILIRAFTEGRILVTLDKDFGELVVLHRLQHFGLIRLVNISAKFQADAILHILQGYPDECTRAIFTVEPGRVRIRKEPNAGGPDE